MVGMDINSCHDDDDILDFLQDTDLIDLFNDFYHNHPPTYMRSDNTMDLVFGSIDLLQWVVDGYILYPNDGPGDQSVIGIDLNYGGLIGTQNLCNMDPTSYQSRLLVSTDIKAIAKYLNNIKKELDAHYIPTHFKTLATWCKQTGHCSQDDERIFQVLCNQMYKIAKQAKSNCKQVGPKVWSTTLASVSQALQIYRKEFYWIIWGGVPVTSEENHEAAITHTKVNMEHTQTMVADAKQQAQALQEAGLEILVEMYAAEHALNKVMVLRQLL